MIIFWTLTQPLVILAANVLLSLSSLSFESIVVIWGIGGILSLIVAFLLVSALQNAKGTPKPSLIEMYDSRHKFHPETLYKEARDKYWSLAVTQTLASTRLSQTIIDMIKAGKEFRFLLIDHEPNASTGGTAGGRQPEFFKESLGKTLHTNIALSPENTLKRFKAEILPKLSREERSRFDVRKYNLPITHTMIVIDPDMPQAKICLEPFTYVAREGATPFFIIEKAKHPEVFKLLLRSFENACSDPVTNQIDWEKI